MKTTDDMRLLPCPFCGADSDQIYHSPDGLIATWVQCTQCGAHSKSVVAEKSLATKAAIKAWNTRPVPAGVVEEQSGWLIESAIQDTNGPHYLCVQRLAGHHFHWKPDHEKALRFCRKEDAERVRDAVRELRADLFPSIVPMPQAVEHGWIGHQAKYETNEERLIRELPAFKKAAKEFTDEAIALVKAHAQSAVVSLDGAARGYCNHLYKCEVYDEYTIDTKQHFKSVCSAVLKAAGVAYVD